MKHTYVESVSSFLSKTFRRNFGLETECYSDCCLINTMIMTYDRTTQYKRKYNVNRTTNKVTYLSDLSMKCQAVSALNQQRFLLRRYENKIFWFKARETSCYIKGVPKGIEFQSVSEKRTLLKSSIVRNFNKGRMKQKLVLLWPI